MVRRRYPVPWREVFALTPYIARDQRAPFGSLCARIARRLDPEPLIVDAENLPPSPRFLLVANHFQRPGLWIAHPASVLAEVLQQRYALDETPIRWIVTANWPRWRIGPWRIASPGDWLLPRVAKALSCYPVPFSGTDPGRTASSLRRLLRDLRTLDCPVGLFPEGVRGTADQPAPPLPGIGRLITLMARAGIPTVPVGISESGQLTFCFGEPLDEGLIARTPDPAEFLMARVRALASGRRTDVAV